MPKKVVQVNTNPNKTPAKSAPKGLARGEGTGRIWAALNKQDQYEGINRKISQRGGNVTIKEAAPRTKTSGLSGRAVGDVGRIGGGGLPQENR